MQELESLQSIFKDRIFRIPDYQRGYAWTTKQLKNFWEDLVSLTPSRQHYTGLLSLKKLDEETWAGWNEEKWLIEDRGYRPFHVVDGQQRLTTFVIFIQAISELLKELPENSEKKDEDIYLGSFSLKEIKESYLVMEKPPQCIIKTYKFGYEADNPSFRFLRHRIFLEQDAGSIRETFYTLNLENSKNFFKENLSEHYKEHGQEEIEVLFKNLTQSLMFNVYEISDDFDVFVAFETMNNRGKTLSNLELLKNRLIYLTTLYEDEELQADECTSLREEINDSWKEVYYQLGRDKHRPLNDDDFLRAHWIMYFQYTRGKDNPHIRFLLEEKFIPQNIYAKTEIKLSSIQAFEEISESEGIDQEEEGLNENEDEEILSRSKLSPKEIQAYVKSLKSAAVHWYNTFHPVNNADLPEQDSLWIDRLNRIGMAYFRPLIAASYLSKTITPDDRVRLFKAIERFIFVAFRLSKTSSSYGSSEFYRATRELGNGELSIKAMIDKLNAKTDSYFYSLEDEETDNGELYFDYGELQKIIGKKMKEGGGFYGWNGLRYFLYEYEMEKIRERGSKKIDWNLFVKSETDKVSIEHIYPQTPRDKCWKEAFTGYSKKQREGFQNTLGNLLPLSRSINSSLQNDCFSDKKNPRYNVRNEKVREGYSDGSHSEIEVANCSNWGPSEILERGLNLLKFMEKRWNIKFEDEDGMVDMLFLDFMRK